MIFLLYSSYSLLFNDFFKDDLFFCFTFAIKSHKRHDFSFSSSAGEEFHFRLSTSSSSSSSTKSCNLNEPFSLSTLSLAGDYFFPTTKRPKNACNFTSVSVFLPFRSNWDKPQQTLIIHKTLCPAVPIIAHGKFDTIRRDHSTRRRV